MLKYWLLVFLLDSDGELVRKIELHVADKPACVVAAGNVAKRYVNKPVAVRTFCVTNAHHDGYAIDPGIPLHF